VSDRPLFPGPHIAARISHVTGHAVPIPDPPPTPARTHIDDRAEEEKCHDDRAQNDEDHDRSVQQAEGSHQDAVRG
jgi:hypothetical protein